MKNFIITIDTEGDNLWSWKEGNKITTKSICKGFKLCVMNMGLNQFG